MTLASSTTQPPSPVPAATLAARLAAVARDIKISHSIFALPFALLATFLAPATASNTRPTLVQVALIVLCMVLARTVAMAANRWADAGFDADNPRTAGRAIPSGRLTRRFMLGTLLVCSAGFVLAAGGFYLADRNPWPLVASPLVLAWLAGYSFAKRFTCLCHLWLGSALALSPLAATLAVAPTGLATPEPYLLFAMVTAWVAGFDIIYALQDVEIDRHTGLHSIPGRLGPAGAMWVSRAFHVACLAALLALGWQSPYLGPAYFTGAAIAAALLLLEHALIARSPQRHLNVAFFTVNGVMSVVVGSLGIADILIRTV